ncbi:MAG: hypothetical protein AVDCRST_MAG31-1212, partial [uncultured Sphingomonas sp.]
QPVRRLRPGPGAAGSVQLQVRSAQRSHLRPRLQAPALRPVRLRLL